MLPRTVLILSFLLFTAAAVLGQAGHADALELYRSGRELQLAGRNQEAETAYRNAIAVCDQELAQDPAGMESFVVKSWCLFRLRRYQDVIDVGTRATAVRFDARVVETMGEAWFYLGKYDAALKSLQKYIENSGEFADRVSTAYFFMGEIYQVHKRYEHADISYSLAVNREPTIALWWIRYGVAMESLGQWQRANDYYGRALKLAPSSVDALSGQQRAKAKLGG
ncbi:MAG: tetratricopeptide repeat protein [Spirochaetes bacterium]|nr:tetratricopeptide repeat protein [Spirochaetota bacterium]